MKEGEPAEIEYLKWRNIEKGGEAEEGKGHWFLNLYRKLDPREHRIRITKRLREELYSASQRWHKEIGEYIELTRHLLRQEGSVSRFSQPEKWLEKRKVLDNKRHQIHEEIKAGVNKELSQGFREKIDPQKTSLLVDLMIGSAIGESHIMITRLLPDEIIIESSKDIEVEEVHYISDWHDPDRPYKHAFIYYNPLKYSEEDIKYKIISKSKK